MRLLLVGVLLAAAVPVCAQPGSVDVQGAVGWTGFLDEGSQDHLLVSGGARFYFTRRWSIQPELQYLRLNLNHHDWVFLPSVNFDFRSGRIVPYLTAGLGVIRTVQSGFVDFSTTEAFLSFGAGAKVYVRNGWFVAPEFRVGLEPHARFSTGIGYSWRK